MARQLTALAIAMAMLTTACTVGDGSTGTTPEGTLGPNAVGDSTRGGRLFGVTCVTCHGAKGAGIEGFGKTLADSEFVDGLSDRDLVDFLVVGRPAGDPLNTTGVDMLPRGGNPSLDAQDLLDIVAFIRTLQ